MKKKITRFPSAHVAKIAESNLGEYIQIIQPLKFSTVEG
jgi:hypothetical protein